MKHLRDMIRAKEKGAVLIWVAGALVALLGAAALEPTWAGSSSAPTVCRRQQTPPPWQV
jgi:hypothetical protein